MTDSSSTTHTDPMQADLYGGVTRSRDVEDTVRLAQQMRSRQREAFLVANPEARGLDTLESSAEGCVTHSYACLCREARAREIWEAAEALLFVLALYHKEVAEYMPVVPQIGRLADALAAWKPLSDEMAGLMEQQARVDAGDRGRPLEDVAEELGI